MAAAVEIRLERFRVDATEVKAPSRWAVAGLRRRRGGAARGGGARAPRPPATRAGGRVGDGEGRDRPEERVLARKLRERVAPGLRPRGRSFQSEEGLSHLHPPF